ncbi:uncharacterized protein LOC132721191 [Ruditapes philippinarum]|uniref:uncharacterized protein LOC132721191 n=1 Tax=Ruditapes philippinarum TaxID=129788 RepID=UPI00295C1AFE|nr:uncharacterized protein LOC132721191 [Ruditapes philippinarum]
MFQEPDYSENLSLMLSEALHDIGVNENIVMRRRRHFMLRETMGNITSRLTDQKETNYFLGSQSEGTTTKGLDSDTDVLNCRHNYNIIQDWSEWEHGKFNYLMIQDENTTPGYCFLQLLKDDEPLPATVNHNVHHFTDRRGRILYKNTMINNFLVGAVQHGPSIAQQGQPGLCDLDRVFAFPCKSWPQSASGLSERQGIGRWPTQKMIRYAASTDCFVVPTGSKVSEYPELEWRISSILAERCLMNNLNITQIRCYVLLKMILKSFLNSQDEVNVSSFMCKTVLLHCIKKREPSIWKDYNLLTCLTFCLLELHSCIQNDSCSHFIIPENNLMAGQFTVTETKNELLKNICELIQNDRQQLLSIDIDDLGHRLQVKLYRVPHGAYYFPSSFEIYEEVFTWVYIDIATIISVEHMLILKHLHNENIRTMKHHIVKLMNFSDNGNRLEHIAFKFLAPFLFTTYGSILASSSIAENNQVSHQELICLSAGLNSDIASSKLKLASVFYSTGDMEKAELILRNTEQQYISLPVLPLCRCWIKVKPSVTAEFMRVCSEQNEDCIKHITAMCVRFIQKEINCVPHELQYEMFRSTQGDMIHRLEYKDCWMDWAVVDSLPFLYFLQYKIYSHLQRHQAQQQALSKLIRTIETDKNLKHRETALNILGQCMEQENRPQKAFNCYLLSLQQRARNNAAYIHICKLLSGLVVNQ